MFMASQASWKPMRFALSHSLALMSSKQAVRFMERTCASSSGVSSSSVYQAAGLPSGPTVVMVSGASTGFGKVRPSAGMSFPSVLSLLSGAVLGASVAGASVAGSFAGLLEQPANSASVITMARSRAMHFVVFMVTS